MKNVTMNTQAIVQLDSGTANAIEEDVQSKWEGVVRLLRCLCVLVLSTTKATLANAVMLTSMS